jgi:hypothetical protein
MNEYITREAVEQVLCGIANGLSVGETEALKTKDVKALYKIKGAKEILNAVDNDLSFIPAADVQPVKHGKWESSQRTIETGTVYCSNCAIEYYVSDLQTVGDCNGIVHYCPNCGARMEQEG